jgi:hypothetical protein
MDSKGRDLWRVQGRALPLKQKGPAFGQAFLLQTRGCAPRDPAQGAHPLGIPGLPQYLRTSGAGATGRAGSPKT